MGFEQVRLADLALKEQDGTQMRMTQFPVTGQIHTHSANNAVTDSAAAGTALACGVRTDNGRIAQLPDGTPVEPVSLKLLKEGMMVGILTSVTANHATPAPFYSHAERRSRFEEIGMQFIDSGVHFLAGRGLHGGKEVGDRILSAYRESGIAVVTEYSDAADVPKEQRMVLLAPSVGSPERQQGDLADATMLAIERMKDNPAGFFMMIEGGAIDFVCHRNLGWACVEEVLAMDRAVEVAYTFYLQNTENTLIVITADHETGGLSLNEEELDLSRLRQIEQQRDRFTAAIPIKAEIFTVEADLLTAEANLLTAEADLLTTGADLLTMEADLLTREADLPTKEDDLITMKTDRLMMEAVMKAIREFHGISEITEDQRKQLEDAVEKGNRNIVIRLAMNVSQAAAGITWNTGSHTGVDVPVYAIGPGAEQFRGTYDITQIPAKIFKAAVGRELFEEPPQPGPRVESCSFGETPVEMRR